MARAGNHGHQFPRDRTLLHTMYWIDKMTLPEMGKHFGVTHKSVHRVMKQLGVQTRGRGTGSEKGCKVCGAPSVRIRHAGNGALYGRMCAEHRRIYRNKLALDYVAARPDVQEKRKRDLERWTIIGAMNPRGELQWLRKGKHLLRTAKRILNSDPSSHAVLRYQMAVSAAEPSSRISCPTSSGTSSPSASPRKSATPRATRAGSS